MNPCADAVIASRPTAGVPALIVSEPVLAKCAATFDASGLKPLGGDRFEALGRLSLKGRQKELKIPVTVKTEAATTVVDGVVPISRKDFAIGAGSWDEVIEDLVKIKFHIVVTK